MVKKCKSSAPLPKAQTRSRNRMKCNSAPIGQARYDLDEDLFDDCVSEPPRPSVKTPLGLISLQKASGYWQLTGELANVCGHTLDELEKACPPELTADNKEDIWATALALSCLAGRFGDEQDEWEMVAAKGTKWLKKNLPLNVLNYDKILEAAARILKVAVP